MSICYHMFAVPLLWQDVETYLAEHSTENKRHIQTLATYLIDNCVLVDRVRREHDDFLKRYEKLESDVSSGLDPPLCKP